MDHVHLPTQFIKNVFSSTFVFDNLKEKLKKIDHKEEKARERKKLDELKKKAVINGVELAKPRNEVEGDTVLRRFRNLSSKRYLNKHQQIILQLFIESNLENIYGDDYKDNEIRIKKENGIKKNRPFALVGCPRRYGKTFIIAWFVACALVTFKGTRVAIFAPALKQCQFFIRYVRQFLSYIRQLGVDLNMPGDSKLEIEVESPYYPGVINSVISLSCNADTSRGVGANIIIADEVSYIVEAYILSVILPLLTVEKTSFAGISTVNGEDNHFYRLLAMHDPDDDNCPIQVYQFYASCFACRRAGIGTACRHLVKEQPRWITSDRKSDVFKMYDALGGSDMADQELSGIVKQKHLHAFDLDSVNEMFDECSIVTSREIGEWLIRKPGCMLFSAIDPTGGGGSDLAIVTAIYEKGICTIVGAESITASKPSECFDKIVLHYKTLRKNPLFRDSPITVWVEGNLIWQYQEITDLLVDNIPLCYVMDKTYSDASSTVIGANQKSKGVKGQMTNSETKQEMWRITKDHLAAKRISFYEDMVTVHHPMPLNKKFNSVNALRHIFKNQMSNFYIILKRAVDPTFSRNIVTFSGKTGKTQGRDDVAMSLMILIDAICRYISTNRERVTLSSKSI